jgi:hypothetical protein
MYTYFMSKQTLLFKLTVEQKTSSRVGIKLVSFLQYAEDSTSYNHGTFWDVDEMYESLKARCIALRQAGIELTNTEGA